MATGTTFTLCLTAVMLVTQPGRTNENNSPKRVSGARHHGTRVPANAGPYEDGLTAYQRGDYLKKRSTKSHSERQQRIKAHRNKAAICARKGRCDDDSGYVKGHVLNYGSA